MSLKYGDKLMSIGGRMTAASAGEWLTSVNPATEELVGQLPVATDSDIDLALSAAARAFPAWRQSWRRPKSM